jgi:hypothetical protein
MTINDERNERLDEADRLAAEMKLCTGEGWGDGLRGRRLQTIMGVSVVEAEDTGEVFFRKLQERGQTTAELLLDMRALANDPPTGYTCGTLPTECTEEERQTKLKALRADGWIANEDGSYNDPEDYENNPLLDSYGPYPYLPVGTPRPSRRLPELTRKDVAVAVYVVFSVVVIGTLMLAIRASPESTAAAAEF